MDTRKLTTKTRTRYDASIYFMHPDPERPNDHGERVAELVGSEDAAELVRRWNAFPALVEVLDMMQEALACYRDGNSILVDHPVHGPIHTLEEVKYLVVDPALKAASE